MCNKVSIILVLVVTVGCGPSDRDSTADTSAELIFYFDSTTPEEDLRVNATDTGDLPETSDDIGGLDDNAGDNATDISVLDQPIGPDAMDGDIPDNPVEDTTLDIQVEETVKDDLTLPPTDLDEDGIFDNEDNCPSIPNPDQANMDGDLNGDVCDPDLDGDFIVNGSDNCPESYNPTQSDMDNDGVGNPCDPDTDGDGLQNSEDNCPQSENPSQDDFDQDGIGDPCDPDDDNDEVPDIADELPFDSNWPGLAIDGEIYAHTSSTLFKFDPVAVTVTAVGPFGWPQGSDTMTDICVDYEGHLFGVSFNKLYRCSAITAECIYLAGLPTSFNGMTVVPVNTVTPGKETLIGIGNNGSWNQIEVQNNQGIITQLGSYGAGYTSAGDAYSIEGLGTYAAVNKSGVFNNVLVEVDPVDGHVLQDVGPLTGYSSVYGLAADGTNAYAFDAGGAILLLDVTTGTTSVVLPSGQGQSWWGAGVTTRYFSKL